MERDEFRDGEADFTDDMAHISNVKFQKEHPEYE